MKPIAGRYGAFRVGIAMALASGVPLASGSGETLPATASTRNLCEASETTIFSCTTTNKKQLAVCGRLPDEVQYRFGTAARLELRYPPSAREGRSELRYAEYHRHLVNRYTLSFDRGEFTYSVFDFDENGENMAGVTVTRKSDGQEFVTRCKGKPRGSLVPLKEHVACDRDSALNLGSCP
jgi:hypothetical protein